MTMKSRSTWTTLSFDCYGTLVDWEAGIIRAFQAEAEADGRELPGPEIVQAYMQVEPEVESGPYRSYREVLTETASRVAERLGWPIDRARAGFLARSLPDWPLFPDTRSAIERLGRQFRLGILSNVDDDLLAATIQAIGVEFDWTVTAEKTRSYKPAPDHFREAIDRVGGMPDRLLHVAQSYYHDVRPGRTLGLSVVWVNRKGEVPPVGPAPSHTVRDLAELADWLTADGQSSSED